jgi:hypothetical protein
MKIVSTILLLCFTLRALSCENAVNLNKGDTVKDCDRVGLSVEYNKKVMKDLVEGDYNKKIIEEQRKIIELKDLSMELSRKQSDMWKEESYRNRSSLDHERGKVSKSLWIGVSLGILMTVAAGYAIGQASKASR